MMGAPLLDKQKLVSFSQKSSFSATGQFGPDLGVNCALLCPRQFCLMIHSIKKLKCSMMGYNSKTKVMLVNLPKKSLSGQLQ